MISLSKEIKYEVFKIIVKQTNPFGDSNDPSQLVDFLNTIWDLHTMPSQDSRYDNAYEDAVKHLVNNDDWDYDHTFVHRFLLLEDNDFFEKFITRILSVEYRVQSEILRWIQLINPVLETEGYKVVKTDYVNSNPVYAIEATTEVSNLPIGIKKNNIVFYLVKTPNGRSDRANSHDTPTQFPAFVLVFNDGWNDYNVYNEFSLFFYNARDTYKSIGTVKIMNLEGDNILDLMAGNFTMLTEKFCSVGQNGQYYKNLKSAVGGDFESALYAIKDAAFFPEIHERFERTNLFINSLIRYDNVERNLRVIKYELNGHDLNNLYKFKYQFKPNFAEEPIDVDFEFDQDVQPPNRIFAFIGKNGTGKTQLMTSLPLDISNVKSEVFDPVVPIFSKVIAVSYSAFDNYQIPQKTASFNYVYCGLKDAKNNMLQDAALSIRFEETIKNIVHRERIDQWRSILTNFIQEEIIHEFLIRKEGRIVKEQGNNYDFKIEGFLKVKTILSSGQKIILYIISEIISNIRFDSLILYDEPETHLHPNAITELMNTIYQLVNDFESYCIIATHSPLIIRELMSKNVFVVEREGNIPSIRRIGIESFGENLSVLTDEVFGNKSVQKQYKKIVQELVDENKSYEEIITLLEFDEIPLSLNIRLYIKSLITNKNA